MKYPSPTESVSMDAIPLDIIHHHLIPLLDHVSRIELNSLLSSGERKSTPLKKEVILEFSALYSRAMIQGLMNTIATCTQREFLKACRGFNHSHFTSLRQFSTFHKKFLRHLTAVSGRLNQRLPDPPALYPTAPPRWESMTKYMRKEIRKQIDDFFIAAVAAFNSTTPKIKFRDDFTVGLPHHVVVKLPVVQEVNYSYTMSDFLENQMEAQLARGRELMAFWAARGDFA